MTAALWPRKSLSTATGCDAGTSKVQNHVTAHAETCIEVSRPDDCLCVLHVARGMGGNRRWRVRNRRIPTIGVLIGPSTGRVVGYKAPSRKGTGCGTRSRRRNRSKTRSARKYVLGDSWSGEQMAWDKASNSGGQRRGCEKGASPHRRFWSGKHEESFPSRNRYRMSAGKDRAVDCFVTWFIDLRSEDRGGHESSPAGVLTN